MAEDKCPKCGGLFYESSGTTDWIHAKCEIGGTKCLRLQLTQATSALADLKGANERLKIDVKWLTVERDKLRDVVEGARLKAQNEIRGLVQDRYAEMTRLLGITIDDTAAACEAKQQELARIDEAIDTIQRADINVVATATRTASAGEGELLLRPDGKNEWLCEACDTMQDHDTGCDGNGCCPACSMGIAGEGEVFDDELPDKMEEGDK